MDKTQFSKICRACLSEKFEMETVSGSELIRGKEIIFADMLMEISSIKIDLKDDLPSKICSQCLVDLRVAYLFKRRCESSDNVLRSICSDLKSEISDCSNLRDDHSNDSLQSESTKEIQSAGKKCYYCDQCGKECLGLSSYWKHMCKSHKLFKCNICHIELKTQKLLRTHKTYHLDKHKSQNKVLREKRSSPRSCDICKKTFRFHSTLERHKLIHTGEKPYLCNVCGKGFAQMSYLKIHSFIHTGEKPYKCQMCDKCFTAPGTLMTHTRIHTGERPHVCKICGKDFPQSGYLSAHIRTHTGEKPIECKVCHKRFNQSGRLVIHMRIHSGEKPFSCKLCSRSFAVKGTLKKHIRTHTGEKPYICSTCGQAFAQNGTLATHMKIHKSK